MTTIYSPWGPQVEHPWIDWPGGECPVEDGVEYEIMFRSGGKAVSKCASVLIWERTDGPGDIVAYRQHVRAAANDNHPQHPEEDAFMAASEPEAPKPLQIEEGKWYRRRDGKVVGPASRDSGLAAWPWLVGECSYMEDGSVWTFNSPDALDLIAEVPAPVAEATGASVGVSVNVNNPMKIVAVPDEIARQPVAWSDATDVKATIADEAKRIVTGARRSAYGKPEDNFERIARLWTAHMRNTGRDIEIVAGDVSLLMILMKIARLAETPDHRDSWVDTVGYALTGAEVNGVAA